MSLRILVVEDHPDVRAALVAGLEHAGHEVLEAATLAAAQAALETGHPAAIVCDEHFPACEGASPAPWGHNFVQGCLWRGLPAILYTASDDSVLHARRNGLPVLPKPAGISEILKALEAACPTR